MRGRPLGFLALVTTAWIGTRVVMLWPTTVAQSVARDDIGPRIESFPPFERALAMQTVPGPEPFTLRVAAKSGGSRPADGGHGLNDAQILALYGLRYFVEERASPAAAALTPATIAPVAPTDAAGAAVASAVPALSRWSVAAWLSVREGRADPRLTPLLGASQAGVRVSYAVSGDRRAAVFARAATPLSHGGTEVAAGVQWRPSAAPVTAFVEARHRQGTGVAPAAGVFGGGTVALPGDFRLDSYGQAGWVGGRDATGFAEGQVRAARNVARIDKATVDVGAGVWGAAQRGAARLDVGPGAGVTLPLGRGFARLGLDWRQRIAGHAAPGSGAALTLGAGF